MSLRWGILSTAHINDKFLAGCAESDQLAVVAVASRDAERAREYADERGIDRAHGSYEALLADPEVDAVYISLPNAPAPGVDRAGAAGRQARAVREAAGPARRRRRRRVRPRRAARA